MICKQRESMMCLAFFGHVTHGCLYKPGTDWQSSSWQVQELNAYTVDDGESSVVYVGCTSGTECLSNHNNLHKYHTSKLFMHKAISRSFTFSIN